LVVIYELLYVNVSAMSEGRQWIHCLRNQSYITATQFRWDQLRWGEVGRGAWSLCYEECLVVVSEEDTFTVRSGAVRSSFLGHGLSTLLVFNLRFSLFVIMRDILVWSAYTPREQCVCHNVCVLFLSLWN